MENFERQASLSAEQQESLDALSLTLKPFIEELKKTNNSNVTEAAMEEVELFKKQLKKKGIDLTDKEVEDYVRSLFTGQG